MPRPRAKINSGLPSRWRFTHGAYYFQVPAGLESKWDGKKTFRLGKNLTEAYKTWSDRLESHSDVQNIGQLLDRYALEVVPKKAISTHSRELRNIRKLKSVFGEMPLLSLLPTHIYKYVDKRRQKHKSHDGKELGGLRTARHEIATLSHAYTKAVEWGYIPRHPFKGEVRLEMTPPRTRYVEDWEIIECLSLSSKMRKGSVKLIQAYIKLKLLTGLRGTDMLQLQETNLKDDGIHVGTSKTGKAIIYGWTEELRAVVSEIKSARGIDIAKFLFVNKYGEGYLDPDKGTSSGWNSMWQRFMARLLEETKITERFTEHDLRAKCASDAETLEHARSLLAHADSNTTRKIYRRKPEFVKPLR